MEVCLLLDYTTRQFTGTGREGNNDFVIEDGWLRGEHMSKIGTLLISN